MRLRHEVSDFRHAARPQRSRHSHAARPQRSRYGHAARRRHSCDRSAAHPPRRELAAALVAGLHRDHLMVAQGVRRASLADRRARRAEVEDPGVVFEAALRFLETRARSEAEVRRRLTGAGYRSVLVEGAITRLRDLGILDDEAFARAWVESRDCARPRGERAIRAELRVKGVDGATVDAILDERRDGLTTDGVAVSPDQDAAERLLARNARALRRVPDPRARRQRAYALLARHGFDPETCRQVSASVTALDGGDVMDEPDDEDA